jgi:cytoskeletal protein CcmA (bactofilin family)
MWSTKKLSMPRLVASKPQKPLLETRLPNKVRSLDSTPARCNGWLGPTLRVRGNISGSDDLLIDGSVEGTIDLNEGKLTIGSAAKLEADINARDVVVSGHVKGNVRATRRIEIKKGGSVIGNVTTAEILIEGGADFKGSIQIDGTLAKPPDANISSIAISGPKQLVTNHSSQDMWTN